jgi:hypothetical protein
MKAAEKRDNKSKYESSYILILIWLALDSFPQEVFTK